MAITIPAKFPLQAKSAMLLPSMGANPLGDLLDATNGLYRWFNPPLTSHAVTDSLSATDREYVIPLPSPSADGLRYQVLVPVQAGAAGTVDIDIDYATSSDPALATWTGLAATAGFAVVNGFTVWDQLVILPANTTMLRLTCAAKSTASRPTHVFVAPEPDPAAAPFAAGGVQPSGFRPHDSALLGTSGNPVTTELVDRVQRNSVSILRDRRQVVASFLAPLSRAAVTAKAPQNGMVATNWHVMGRANAQIPVAGGHTLTVQALARVSAGATTDLVEVTAIYANSEVSCLLRADSTVQTGSLAVAVDGEGFLDLRIRIKATAGNTTTLHALTVSWRADANKDPSERLTGTGFRVSASGTLLQSARAAVENRGLAPYAAVGHMVDFQTTGRATGQIHVAIPRAVKGLRISTWRCADHDPTVAQSPTLLAGTTDGSLASPSLSVAVPTSLWGSGRYWDCQQPGASGSALLVGGEKLNGSPSGLQDRQLAVIEDLVGSIELIEIQQTAGFCIFVGAKTLDPLTL